MRRGGELPDSCVLQTSAVALDGFGLSIGCGRGVGVGGLKFVELGLLSMVNCRTEGPISDTHDDPTILYNIQEQSINQDNIFIYHYYPALVIQPS